VKIFIFGPPGSGKTTLAKRLSKMLSVKHFELDELFFDFEKGTQAFIEKREQVIEEILSNNKWIIEGMYLDSWLEKIIQKSDHIFLLNPPKTLSYFRLSKRTIKRMIKLEKHERKSDFEVLFYLLNHIRTFKNKKNEFINRISLERKTVFESKWKSNIINFLKENSGVGNT
jgi:adenylate kinase family enzyme